MKVSFDFDSTLSRNIIQDFAIELMNKGYEVWIVTSRFNDDPKKITDNHPSWMKAFKVEGTNNDLRDIAVKLNIPKERIVYTNMEFKATFFKDKDFILHLDDDWVEINEINKKTSVRGISVFGNNVWKQKSLKVLEKVLSN